MILFVWTEIKICVYYRLRLQSCGRSLIVLLLFFTLFQGLGVTVLDILLLYLVFIALFSL